jgi:hypothetical protein
MKVSAKLPAFLLEIEDGFGYYSYFALETQKQKFTGNKN